jgi:sodium-dependent dicarboxylate transporter 2/3/5
VAEYDSRNAARRLYHKLHLGLFFNTSTFVGNLVIAAIATWLFRQLGYGNLVDFVFLISVLSIGLWITEAVPPFAVGIMIVSMMVFGFGTKLISGEVRSVQAYTSTWTSNVIWLLLGGFFLAEGMKEVDFDRKLFQFTIRRFGDKPERLLLGLISVTALASMVMSNTATTTMMISSVMPLIRAQGKGSNFSKALLISIPTAATIGGIGTIIGSTPNAIAVGALLEKNIRVTFLEWMLFGLPTAVLLLYVFYRLLIRRFQLGDTVLDLEAIKGAAKPVDRAKKNAVLFTLVLTIALWATEPLHGVPVAATSAVPILLLTLTQVIRAEQVRALPWDTLMLVAGGLALGIALVDVGLARIIMEGVTRLPLAAYGFAIFFSIVAVLLSNVMSNTAAASILVPLAVTLPEPFGTATPVIIAISCSCALLLPVSTPSNAIAYATGLIEQRAFRFGGIFFILAGPIAAFTAVMLWIWLYLYH